MDKNLTKNFEPSNFIIQSVCNTDYASVQKLFLRYSFLELFSEECFLKKKIKNSEDSFADNLPYQDRNFLFVLKDLCNSAQNIIGSSQIAVQLGSLKNPLYSLKISKKNNQIQNLQLKINTNGPSYLGGLILDKKYRGHVQKLGKQLSLIRFLFVAIYADYFKEVFSAEIAPFIDSQKKNPFFEHFIKHFIPFTLKEIDYLTVINKQKLFSYYPRKKFLFSDLPKIVRSSFALSGEFSKKARGFLEKQNFYFSEEVDPFDSGPYMHGNIKQIPVIQNTQKVCIKKQTINNIQNKKIKYLWGVIKSQKFKGGVLEGVLREGNFFVSPHNLTRFVLTEGSFIFISPFE